MKKFYVAIAFFVVFVELYLFADCQSADRNFTELLKVIKQEDCEKRYKHISKFKCCGGLPKWVPRRRTVLCCGERPYVQEAQICCGNQIQSKALKSKTNAVSLQRCCARKQPYIGGKELCCNKEVVNSTIYGCCRNVIYVRQFATCCMGEVAPILFSLNANVTIGCCGGEPYDVSKKICCNFQLFDFIDGDRENTKCCKFFPYNDRTHICCNNIRRREPSKDSCCYGKLMDSKTHICCDFRQQELKYGKDHTACCRTDNFKRRLPDKFILYDKKAQLCCGGKVVQRVGEDSSCCIQQAYDVRKQICCNQKIHEKSLGGCSIYRCCGKRIFCADEKICCAGKYRNKYRAMIFRQREKTARCCGWRKYDRKRYECLANNVLARLG